MIGPISVLIDPKGIAPDALVTKIWAGWKGQTPGEILMPEATLSGQPKAGTAPVVLAEEDNGSQVQLVPDQKLLVSLASNPTTGYSWQVEPLDEQVLKQLGEPTFKPEATDKMGAPGLEVFEFQAVGPGQVTLNMGYSRPWEKDAKPEKMRPLRPDQPPPREGEGELEVRWMTVGSVTETEVVAAAEEVDPHPGAATERGARTKVPGFRKSGRR